MVELDIKDKKILYQLDIDSRQSFAQIGRKVGLSKNTIAYRMNKLEENGLITNYYTVINPHKLGFITPRFHFTYQYATPVIKHEIIKYFTCHPKTMIVGSTKGVFDLSVMFCITNIQDLYNIWKDIQVKYSYYFQYQIFSFWIGETRYKPSYLIKKENTSPNRIKLRNIGMIKDVEVDEIELGILKLIAPNARMSVTDIAETLKLTSTVVQYRINKLVKLGVIQGFGVGYDLDKLGYNLFKVNMNLTQYDKRRKIIGYIGQNPHLYCIDDSSCESHLECEFHLPHLGQLYNVMEDVIAHFPDAIKNYNYFSVTEVHKYLYMPVPK